MNERLNTLFDNNAKWSADMLASDPEFFTRLAHQQNPKYLWIGCSDSRVPANQIIGLPPGEVFVHRNIANVMVHSDLNGQSVLQFAVEHLSVTDVIVCGHYGCSGVLAALTERRLGLAEHWIRHVRDVHNRFAAELTTLIPELDRHRRLCELNVIAQATNVAHSLAVQDAWAAGAQLAIHGLVYDIADGRLKDLNVTVTNNASLLEVETAVRVLASHSDERRSASRLALP